VILDPAAVAERGRELAQIGAADEGALAGSRQDDRTHVAVVRQARRHVAERVDRRVAQRVDRRVVDHDHRDAGVDLDADRRAHVGFS